LLDIEAREERIYTGARPKLGENAVLERNRMIAGAVRAICHGESRRTVMLRMVRLGMVVLRNGWLALFLSASVLGSAGTSLAADEEYDQDGKLVRSVDEKGEEVEYRYDEEGRVVEEQHSDGTTTRHEIDEEPSGE